MRSKYVCPQIIAEVGCNHMGNFDIAIDLITLAKQCGATAVKFQKRNPKELLSTEQYNAPHPQEWQSYGATYGAHREYLEFTLEQHEKLQSYCHKIGIEYSTSVWDLTSTKEIIKLNPKFIKVPSACNNNIALLQLLRDTYTGDVHISVGMTTHKEEETLISFFEETNSAKNRLVIYSCTSGYPVPFEDVCLLEIKRLEQSYGKRVKEIGFSGHHNGISIDIAAYALGASWVERHFTKDRTWKGTDHAASLEAPGLSKLVRDLHAVYKGMTFKSKEILDIEEPQRQKLKYTA